jgi:nitrate reductase NapE component
MEIPCIDLNSSVHNMDTFSALAASVVIHSPLLDAQPFTFWMFQMHIFGMERTGGEIRSSLRIWSSDTEKHRELQ